MVLYRSLKKWLTDLNSFNLWPFLFNLFEFETLLAKVKAGQGPHLATTDSPGPTTIPIKAAHTLTHTHCGRRA